MAEAMPRNGAPTKNAAMPASVPVERGTKPSLSSSCSSPISYPSLVVFARKDHTCTLAEPREAAPDQEDRFGTQRCDIAEADQPAAVTKIKDPYERAAERRVRCDAIPEVGDNLQAEESPDRQPMKQPALEWSGVQHRAPI